MRSSDHESPYFAVLCHLVPPRHIYFSEHPIFKHPWPVSSMHRREDAKVEKQSVRSWDVFD